MFKIGTFGAYCRILLPILTLLTSLILKINPTKAISLNSPQQQLPSNLKLRAQIESTEGESINKSDRSTLAKEVLSEINRARTNPQGYAAWLQEQRQHYDGILLELPGEKPVRTNKGLQALAEAIDFLNEQEPLPNLTISDELSTAAAAKLTQIGATETGEDFKNISYGKVTASGIVMHLIVDDGFPDRRHRTSIFNPNFSLAGIICQDNELYDNICAIAYEGESVDVAAQPNVENNQLSPASDATTEPLPQSAPPNPTSNPEVALGSTVPEGNREGESNSARNDLPDVPEIQVPTITPNSEPEAEVATEESSEAEASDVATSNEPEAEVATEESSEAEANDVTPNSEPEAEVATEKSSATEASDVATSNESETENPSESATTEEDNSPRRIASLLEKTERGILEEGDETIPNDGSFYDSYPLEGNAGDSFIISLESQDFDTFVAILDSEGNILDQNDDINEENSNSRLRITLPSKGVYNVIVNSYDKGGKGRYTLTVRR